MNIDQKLVELRAIHENYTTMGHLKPLLIDISLMEDHLNITWLEGNKDGVYVDLNGWFVGDAPEKSFPTFEGLCMWRSTQFSVQWGIQLEKLLRD